MAGELALEKFILWVIIAVLGAIVYSLRVLVLMERRVASIEGHIERVVDKIAQEEIIIEKEIKKARRGKKL